MSAEQFLILIALIVVFCVGFRSAISIVETIETKTHHRNLEVISEKHFAALEEIIKSKINPNSEDE